MPWATATAFSGNQNNGLHLPPLMSGWVEETGFPTISVSSISELPGEGKGTPASSAPAKGTGKCCLFAQKYVPTSGPPGSQATFEIQLVPPPPRSLPSLISPTSDPWQIEALLTRSPIFLSLAHSALATLASVLFLDLGGPAPTLGPLYCLVPLPGTFFPQISACTAKSFTSIKTLLKCHLLHKAYPH